MTFLRRWWWPSYAFLFPLVFWPVADFNLPGGQLLRLALTLVALVGGLVVAAYGSERATPRVRAVDWARANVASATAVLLAALTLVSATLAPVPGVALGGALEDYSDGALVTVAYLLAFVLVNLECKRDSTLVLRVAAAVVAGGLVLAVAGVYEVASGRGTIFIPAPAQILPLVTFPQRGHLAGYMTLALGAGVGLWLAGYARALAGAFLLAVGIGLTFNRAALLGILTAAGAGITRPRRALVAAAVVAAGLVGGLALTRSVESGAARELTDSRTASSRLVYWRAAAAGIAARPLTGWGGGQVKFAWPSFLDAAGLTEFFRLEYGDRRVIRQVAGDEITDPVFLVENGAGATVLKRITRWKAHNQLLDVALMWGVPAAVLYLGLFVLGVRGVADGNPASHGILAYGVFLLFWFVPPHAEGALFALWGAACAGREQAARSAG